MRRLHLVRHAEPEESARGRCYGSLDVGLSEAGVEQARRLGDELAPLEIDAVLSSPRRRSLATAAAIAERHGLAVEPAAALRELDFGSFEGRTYDDIAATHPELFARWMEAPTTVTFPDGESYGDLRARVVTELERLLDTRAGETVVAVTHGGVVRAIVAHVLGIEPERIFRLGVATASVTVIEWSEGTPIVEELNRRLRG